MLPLAEDDRVRAQQAGGWAWGKRGGGAPIRSLGLPRGGPAHLPDASNWSPGNVECEARGRVEGCAWYHFYDFIEAVHAYLRRKNLRVCLRDGGTFDSDLVEGAPFFSARVNALFVDQGVGWQLIDGEVRVRGDDQFEATIVAATQALEERQMTTSAGQLREALRDLSRRPEPDCTGAVQHALAALECLAREVSGDRKATFGAILSSHKEKLAIPAPLDKALGNVWGYASEQGRHLREGREPTKREAGLLVSVSAAMTTYLIEAVPKPVVVDPVQPPGGVDDDLPF
jgi:hypothetical protein